MVTSICVVGGAGLIGRRHVEHCITEPTVEISCIVDPTPTGEKYAQEQGFALYKTVDELLNARAEGKVKVDGVILATPNSTHVPLAIQLLEAEIPTLVEKPLSTDALSGRTLVEAEKSSRAKVLVGHHRRFNPYVVNAKALIDSGSLGQILAVQGQWTALKPLSYFQAPTEWRQDPKTGGVVLINLVHDIDLFRHFFGNIIRVYCEVGSKTRGFEVDETGAITLKFASAIISISDILENCSAAASAGHFESASGENTLIPQLGEPIYSIVGTKGSFSFPDLKLHHYRSTSEAWFDKLTVDPSPPIDPTPPFTYQLRHFVKIIEGMEEPNCSAQDALLTIMTLEAILESAKTGLPVQVSQS